VRIIGFAAENMASTHLRVRQWIHAMAARGHDATFYGDALDDLRTIDAKFKGADVAIYGRTHDMKRWSALQAGRKLYGFKIVCDTDDLVTDIPSYNFASRVFHNATGFKRIAIGQYRDADAVTCSTDYLRAATAEYNNRCYMVPNVADMSLWKHARARQKEPRHRGDVRIYWGGGGGHYNDLLMIRDAMLRIYHQYPQTKFIFSNFVPGWIAGLSAQRVFFLPLVPYQGPWQRLIRWLCVDIGLAPLEQNNFNRAKSHVKYLDYAMAGVAGVYQRIDAYDSVLDGATGLLAGTPEEWYEKMKVLVENAGLRDGIGRTARREVEARWTVDTHAARYEQMLKRIVEYKPPEVKPLVEGAVVETQTWAP